MDDVVEMRYLMRVSLEELPGCEIVGEAENGEQAVELATALQPDVVVLDVGMPIMDGLQALPEIKRRAPAAGVVVFSSEPELRERALGLGALRWIDKSSGVTEVIAAVREALEFAGSHTT